MEFEFYDSIYIEASDLKEMFLLCRDKGYSVHDAVKEVSLGFDDADYYKIPYVIDDIEKEIEYRLNQSRKDRENAKESKTNH